MNIFIFALLPLLYLFDRIRLKGYKFLFEVDGLRVFLDESKNVNAYVIGNNLVITRGFLALNYIERRAILAHEVAHLVLKHYSKTKLITFIGLGIGFILFQFNILFSLIALIITFVLQRYISRKGEIEADRLAYKVVGDSLKAVIAKYAEDGNGFLSSHPRPEIRVKLLLNSK